MAVDKLVDSTQLNADLTSVANAIRTKGGTSAQLAFPSGFVSAIGDIQTGGGITSATVLKHETFVASDVSVTLTLQAATNTVLVIYAVDDINPAASGTRLLAGAVAFVDGTNKTGFGRLIRADGTLGTSSSGGFGTFQAGDHVYPRDGYSYLEIGKTYEFWQFAFYGG